jgi:hypothetical protein
MRARETLALVTAAFFISSPSIAQTSPCMNTCYQHYLAGMNACRWASNLASCSAATEQAYFDCRLDCLA